MEEESKVETTLLKVKATTEVRALSGSIVSSYDKEPHKQIILRAIGAGAVNQAMKAAVTSNQFFGKKGLYVAIVPSLITLADEGNFTALEMRVDIRKIKQTDGNH